MKKNILISIGQNKNKKLLLPFIKKIPQDKFDIYATEHTSKLLKKNKINNKQIYKVSQSDKRPNLFDYLIRANFELIINIPTRKKHHTQDKEYTDGRYIRKKAVENNITLITDTDVAALYLSNLANNFRLTRPKEKAATPKANPFTAFYHSMYNINKSYDFNYEFGPFFYGVYPPQNNNYKSKFLNFRLNSTFGIPAGPLLNSRWVEEYARLGFDILTYKTIRTVNKACHQPPNIVFIDEEKEYDYDFQKPAYSKQDKSVSYNKISITNSFGVPSKEPDVWQEDVERLLTKLTNGQLLILSVMGTSEQGMTAKEFIADFVHAAVLAKETGVKAIEINLSCPNLGSGAICKDVNMSFQICKRVRKAIDKTPLFAKIGYFEDTNLLSKLIKRTHRYIDCYVAINTVPKKVYDFTGIQALPGRTRLISGTCGAVIKEAGINTVSHLNIIRKSNKYSYKIIGVGGVMSPQDYFDYLDAGADAVQSATGAMWNPYLAYQVKKSHQKYKK